MDAIKAQFDDLLLFGGVAVLIMFFTFFDMKQEASQLASALVGAVTMYLKGK